MRIWIHYPSVILFSLSILFSPISEAVGLAVDKIRFNLSKNQLIDAITLGNSKVNEGLAVEIQPVRWTQLNGQDKYEPTRELLAVPPIVKLGPKGSQIVRIALRRPVDAQQELAYRIFIREISSSQTMARGVSFKLNLSIPVFVAPEVAPTAKLNWQVASGKNAALYLKLQNQGNVHVQVKKITLTALGQEKPFATLEKSVYVLPGQSGQWPLPAKQMSNQVKLTATTDQGEFNETLSVNAG